MCYLAKRKGYINDTYMLPPRSFELSVIVTAPNQTTTKTSANCGPPSFSPSTELFCSILRNSNENVIIFYTKQQKHAFSPDCYGIPHLNNCKECIVLCIVRKTPTESSKVFLFKIQMPKDILGMYNWLAKSLSV